MTKPRWKDPAADEFVLPDIVASTQNGRWSATDVKRTSGTWWRFAPTDRDRWQVGAVVGGDGRWRFAGNSRWHFGGTTPRWPPKPDSKLVRRVLLQLPPPTPPDPGDVLLWMPAAEYERSFEEWDFNMWVVGHEVDFAEALESLSWQGYDPGLDENPLAFVSIQNLEDTFQSDAWEEFTPSEMPFAEALALRKVLAEDPERVARALSSPMGSQRMTARMLGWGETLDFGELAAAVASDPGQGLGAMALDFAIWNCPEDFGEEGARLAATLEELNNEFWLRRTPVENFVMWSSTWELADEGSVREINLPGGKQVCHVAGKYVVTQVDYHHDATGTVVGGWRTCWLGAVSR